ncbi:hypothetical protein BB558_003343 [Smittium angustum]|uniref:HhH-GPD domain-containing protein n=1 Tax=Smittium angustum TaxID=133377 RepID=A0A2U1J680_SMIAN|nr:hypothetical protein BB558_003343 [Smittium angustum]
MAVTRRSPRLISKIVASLNQVSPTKTFKKNPSKPKLTPIKQKQKTPVKNPKTENKINENSKVSLEPVNIFFGVEEITDVEARTKLVNAIDHLSKVDPKLKIVIENSRKSPIELFVKKTSESAFESLARSIISQQISGKAARSVYKKFMLKFGKKVETPNLQKEQNPEFQEISGLRFPYPKEILKLQVEDIRTAGLSMRKAEYFLSLSTHFHNNNLNDSVFESMTNEEISKDLIQIKGIGQWTVDMLLMFHFERLDVLPTLDLAIKKFMCAHFDVPFTKKTPTHNDMIEMAKPWEPYRSIASWYMWRHQDTVLL